MIVRVVDCRRRQREHPEREPAREPVLEHRLGDDERADEHEDGRGAERREDVVGVADAEEHEQRDADQAAEGIGIASVIHRTITTRSAAASVCCCCSRSSGSSRKTMTTSGARNRPTVRRPLSKRSSAGLSFCSPRLRYCRPWRLLLRSRPRRPRSRRSCAAHSPGSGARQTPSTSASVTSVVDAVPPRSRSASPDRRACARSRA